MLMVYKSLFIQYYSVICRPSDHSAGRPRAEILTPDGRSSGRHSNHTSFNILNRFKPVIIWKKRKMYNVKKTEKIWKQRDFETPLYSTKQNKTKKWNSFVTNIG